MDDFRSMLPFFVFGAFLLRRWEVWKDWRIGAVCLALYMLGVLLQGDIGKNGLSFYGKGITWEAFVSDWKALPLYLARIANGVLGSVGIMWFLYALCRKFSVITKLAPLGMTTLWVYILHQWLLDRVVGCGWHNASIWCVLMWTVLLFEFSHVCGSLVKYLVGRAEGWCAEVR